MLVGGKDGRPREEDDTGRLSKSRHSGRFGLRRQERVFRDDDWERVSYGQGMEWCSRVRGRVGRERGGMNDEKNDKE